MAKTLDSLVQKSQSPSTSTSIGQVAQVSSANIQVGESLANDMLGIIKPVAQTVQEYNTASVKAAQRTAMDKSTQLSEFINEQNRTLTPASTADELRKAQSDRQTFYAMNTKIDFDNEDAQNTFNRMYTKDMGVSVGASNAKLEVSALKHDATTNFTNSISGHITQLQADVPVNSEQYSAYIDIMTSGGWYTRDQAEAALVKNMNQVIEGKYETLDSLDVYQPNGLDIDLGKLDSVFIENWGNIAEMQDGSVVGKDGVSSGALQSAQNTYNKLIDNNRKARQQATMTSAIPDNTSSIALDGSMGLKTGMTKLAAIHRELAVRRDVNPDAPNTNEYKVLEKSAAKAELKVKLISNATERYNEWAAGNITYQDYLNKTASRTTSMNVLGQPVHMSMTISNANSFASHQQDLYDNQIRFGNYDGIVEAGANPFKAIARAERDSGGVVKSKYMQQLSKDISNGVLSGSGYVGYKSEYNKAIDYMTEKKTIPLTWLTPEIQGHISGLMKSLDDQVKNETITEMQAGVKFKATVDAWQNASALDGMTVDKERMNGINEALNTMTADDLAGEGWLNPEFGDQKYMSGSKRLMYDYFKDPSKTQSPEQMKGILAKQVVIVRSSKENRALWASLPFRDGLLLYTGGAGGVTAEKASEVIYDRLNTELGDKWNEAMADTVTMRQDKDDSGNIITSLYVREDVADNEPYRVFTFSMDEFAKGVKKKVDTEEDNALTIQPRKTVDYSRRKNKVDTKVDTEEDSLLTIQPRKTVDYSRKKR